MAKVHEYWLQLEDHSWDVCPWGIDRMTGQAMPRAATGAFRAPTSAVLVLRRYATNWGNPIDEPVNAWDLTEPGATSTPGVLPAAVLEAKIADEIVVHFRNLDQRPGRSEAERTHSLHAHGVQRTTVHDGTFPLVPPDASQGGRRGDRVPPGGTFTYRWSCPQRAAAGAWLVHDQSITGRQSLAKGAFGVLLIRASGEMVPDRPARAVRQVGDMPLRFTDVPQPPKRGEYILVFHQLPGVGLCLNGRQGLGNTPALVVGEGTRLTLHCLNATGQLLAVHLHGHRWAQGDRFVDVENVPSGGGTTLSLLEGSAEYGGGLGEWLIAGQAGDEQVSGSLVVTAGGVVTLANG